MIVKNGKTYENEQAYITWLEEQNTALLAKSNKTKPGIEFRITLEDGLFQIRRLTSKSINLPIEAVRWIIEHAQEILKFESTNKFLLHYGTDDETTTSAKALARTTDLETHEKSVVRKPRAENKTETA